MTKVKLDLISDVDMYLFFEKGVRDGVAYISKSYSKANNLTSYDPKKPTNYIIYLDKNNSYAYGMSKSLPTGKFKWLDPAKFNFNKYDSNSLSGSLLEVALEYP